MGAKGDFFFRAVLAIRPLAGDFFSEYQIKRASCSGFARRDAGEFSDADDVLAQNVTFEVDEISRLREMQIRVLPRVRDDLHVEVPARRHLRRSG